MNDDKRRQRKLKRDVKKAGNRKLRNYLKRQLVENPEEAAHAADDFDYGNNSSSTLNGQDRDQTRLVEDKETGRQGDKEEDRDEGE
jgi:hypothetical protein